MADSTANVMAYLNRLVSQRSAASDAAAAAARAADTAPPAPSSTRSAAEKPVIAGKGKNTCATCKRDVRIVDIEQADGSVEKVAFDPEVMMSREYPKGKRRIHTQRVHAERCSVYQLENEKLNEKRSKIDRWKRQMAGG